MNESNAKMSLESILMSDFSLVKNANNKRCGIARTICSFCKCTKEEKEKNKSYYITKWRKYLTKENQTKESLNDPFTILLNLWAHKKNIIKDLESVRINPNMITPSTPSPLNIIIRNDLEFYIPQICSFILFGDVEVVEESLTFLCKASFTSFFFAHRVIWFLKSMLIDTNDNADFNMKIKNTLHVIQTIYKSDSDIDKKVITKYNIAGSDQYISMVNNSAMMNDKENENSVHIDVFKRYDYVTNNDISSSTYTFKQIDNNDINLTSFLSTIHFFDSLCGVCDRIRYIETHAERENELYRELTKINNGLPYNVYIPFCNRNIRNYLIGEFSLNDCKVFKTKERAPILLTALCFKIEEIAFEQDKTTSMENRKSVELERIGLYKKGDSELKRQYDKISYLMAIDISISKPVFVGKEKRKSIKEKEEDHNNLKREEEYKKIEQVVKDSKKVIDLDSPNNTSDEESIISTTPKKSNGNSIRGRSPSISSESSDSPSSDNESEISISSPNVIKDNTVPSNLSNIFGETFTDTEYRLKAKSRYGALTSFKISKFIIKSGEDFLQEQFASQLINEFAQIFKIEKVDCFLYPYEVISTGPNAGIIEVVPNAISIDELKQKSSNLPLTSFYRSFFRGNSYHKAIKNLISSLAGYSLVCYFLQLKDRHNGNILIDTSGHLIHIDFGFILSHAPGHEFENAPFKLTNEIIDIIGGVDSSNFEKFRKLMWKGMIAISKHFNKIMLLVEMMYCGYGKNMECFENGEETLKALKERFKPKEKMKKKDYLKLVDELIQSALSSWRTKWYDKYQYYFQGIFY